MASEGTSTRTTMFAYGAILVLAGVAAVLVFNMPPVQQLGRLVRLVVFHGGSTWVNLATFSLAGLASLGYLVLGKPAFYAWASGFRWFSMPLWVINTGLGLLSSRLAWGQVELSEPRLRATFWILLGAGIVVGADLVLERPKVTAVLDALLAGAMWFFIVLSPNVVHPDNPVLNSDWYIKGPFFGIVGSLFMIAMLTSWLLSRRMTRAA